MSNAINDDNYVKVMLGVSSTSATTPVPIEINPTTGEIQLEWSSGTLTATARDFSLRDDSFVASIIGVDSTDDTKIVQALVDPTTGALLCEA